jgi:hypothetical protein
VEVHVSATAPQLCGLHVPAAVTSCEVSGRAYLGACRAPASHGHEPALAWSDAEARCVQVTGAGLGTAGRRPHSLGAAALRVERTHEPLMDHDGGSGHRKATR